MFVMFKDAYGVRYWTGTHLSTNVEHALPLSADDAVNVQVNLQCEAPNADVRISSALV